MWQTVLVFLIVAASAVYAAWLLLPAVSRTRLAGWLAARLPGASGPFAWLHAWLRDKARPAAPPTGCDACPQSRIEEPRPGGPPKVP